jgi:hypothetical protein
MIVLVAALAALPARAQRGGPAGHVGFTAHASGFAAHSAPPFRAAPAFSGRSSFTAASPYSGYRNATAVGRSSADSSNHRYGVDRDGRYRRPYGRTYAFGYPYAVTGWVGPAYPGYFDSSFYDDSAAPSQSVAYSDDASGAAPLPPQVDSNSNDQPEVQPAPVFRPAYVRQQPEPEPASETAVTVIFKDGRPSEQIHNYMLTRTTLYVQEQHLRKIPVDQIDLEATSRANLDAGVDFSLPNVVR